jgi:hypothetical protein
VGGMAKTNYTKVEEILEQGLRRMSINQLFDESKKVVPEKSVENPIEKEHEQLLSSIKRDLKYLHYKGHAKLYNSLGMKKSELKKLIDTPNLSDAEWEKITQIKKKIDLYKAELAAQLPEIALKQTVEDERIKHINKRFNVNEKWLPLH